MSLPETSEKNSVLAISAPTGLDGIGVVLSIVAWGMLAGPLGFIFGGLLAVGVFTLTAPFAFAVGQVLVLGVINEASLFEAIIAEVGLLLILLSGFAPSLRQYRSWLETTAITAITMALGYAAIISNVDIWVTVAVGVATWSLIVYGLHRFELVQLGLITEDS